MFPWLPRGEVYFNQTNAGCCPVLGATMGKIVARPAFPHVAGWDGGCKCDGEWVGKLISLSSESKWTFPLKFRDHFIFTSLYNTKSLHRWLICASMTMLPLFYLVLIWRSLVFVPVWHTHQPLIRVKVWFDPWTRLAVCDWVSQGDQEGGLLGPWFLSWWLRGLNAHPLQISIRLGNELPLGDTRFGVTPRLHRHCHFDLHSGVHCVTELCPLRAATSHAANKTRVTWEDGTVRCNRRRVCGPPTVGAMALEENWTTVEILVIS